MYHLFPGHITKMCESVLVGNGKNYLSPCWRRMDVPSLGTWPSVFFLIFLDINGTQWLICFHFPNSMGQSTGAVVPGAYQAPALVQNPVLTGSHLRTGGFQPSPLPVLGPFLVEPGEMGLALVIAQWKEKSVVENREWSSWNRSVVGGAAPLWCSRQMASSQSWNNSRVHLGIPQGPSEHATQKSCWLVSLKKEWIICFSNVAVCNHVGREMIVPNPFLAS